MSRDSDAFIAYVRGRDIGNRHAVRLVILQLSVTGEDGSKHSHDVLPRDGRAGRDVVPRVRARLGVCTAQDARKYALIEIDEVVQTNLGRRGESKSNGKHMRGERECPPCRRGFRLHRRRWPS